MEIELKFAARGDDPLLVLEAAERLGPVGLGPPVRFDETDRYLDTVELAVAAAGWACRLRLRGDRWIVSLKGPPAAHAGDGSALHRRPEVEGPATDSTEPMLWPPSAARTKLLGLARGEPIVERLRLEQHRTERRVFEDGRQLGILSLDRTAVVHRGRRLGEMKVVELELTEAGQDRQTSLAAALAGVAGLEPEPRNKLECALELTEAADRPARSE
jgi:inorganic triphosphatase YgiF